METKIKFIAPQKNDVVFNNAQAFTIAKVYQEGRCIGFITIDARNFLKSKKINSMDAKKEAFTLKYLSDMSGTERRKSHARFNARKNAQTKTFCSYEQAINYLVVEWGAYLDAHNRIATFEQIFCHKIEVYFASEGVICMTELLESFVADKTADKVPYQYVVGKNQYGQIVMTAALCLRKKKGIKLSILDVEKSTNPIRFEELYMVESHDVPKIFATSNGAEVYKIAEEARRAMNLSKEVLGIKK